MELVALFSSDGDRLAWGGSRDISSARLCSLNTAGRPNWEQAQPLKTSGAQFEDGRCGTEATHGGSDGDSRWLRGAGGKRDHRSATALESAGGGGRVSLLDLVSLICLCLVSVGFVEN